ncbi:MAG: PQQ-binding-like beta-propeller repeat protein, partial [Bythopirellula sp.]
MTRQFSIALSLCGLLIANSAVCADWPMWRHDANRSAAAIDTPLPAKLHLQWTREYATTRPAWQEDARVQFDHAYEPIVIGQTMLLSSAQTDSVTAIDTRTGVEKWRYFANGPVRFAPVATADKVYFGADDGVFYCLNLATGSLNWKFNAAPNPRKVLGNERLISVWPIRGGPVLHDGRIWFIAGVWPFEGAFLYSFEVDAAKSQPTVDVTTLPTDLLPQGYLAANSEGLFIPTGRGTVVEFEFASREFKKLPYESRGVTDYHVTLGEKWLFHGLRIYDTDNDHLTKYMMNRPVSAGQVCYDAQPSGALAATDLSKLVWTGKKDDSGRAIMEKDVSADWGVSSDDLLSATAFQPAIESHPVVMLRAGNRIYGHWDRVLFAVDIPTDSKRGSVSWTTTLPEQPTAMVVADGRLLVTTTAGAIYCYGQRQVEIQHRKRTPLDLAQTSQRVRVAQILEKTKAKAGYGVVLGAGSEELIDELLLQSALRLIVLDRDADRIDALRERFARSDLYGTRLVAYVGDPTTFSLPPYLANLVVMENQNNSHV